MRRSFTAKCKLRAIRYAEEHGKTEVASQFEVDIKIIGEWEKKKKEVPSVNKKTQTLNKSPSK